MTWNLRSPTLCLCSGLLVAVAASAQQVPLEESPSIKVEVRQVLVPVVVTDRQGHHVTGLKASDFRVFEDDVEQQIVSFGTGLGGEPFLPTTAPGQAEPLPTPQSPQPTVETPPPIRRTYLIIIDSLFLNFGNTSRLRQSLEKVFEEEESDDSHYALVVLGRSLRILRSVTRNPEEILSLVENKEINYQIFEGAPSMAAQERQLTTMLEDYCRGCPCSSALTGRAKYLEFNNCKDRLDQIERWAGSAALERSHLTRDFLRNLADIIVKMGKQPGKRILVSDGFNLWAGRELFTLIGIYTGRPNFIIKNPGDRLGPELQEIERAATSNDVVVYSVDSRGLPAPTFGVFDATEQRGSLSGFGAGQRTADFIREMSLLDHARQDTMARLADVTGGVFFHGSNDLAKGMRQALADGREYYVLAYVPSNRSEDGEFREIRVEVKNKRVNVRAKEGYWAPGPPPSASVSPAQ